jgi:hypothetical protein
MLYRTESLALLVHINNSKNDNVPNTLQVHGSDLHHVTNFLALENTITSPSRHAGHIEQLRAVNHVIICSTGTLTSEPVPGSRAHRTFSPRDTDALCLHLKAKTALIFPKSGSHPRLHSWRCDLACLIKLVLWLASVSMTWSAAATHVTVLRGGPWHHS